MLISRKSHSWVERRNSQVSIKTWFRPSTYLLPAWSESDRWQGREGGGAIAGRPAPDAVPGQCQDPIAVSGWSINIAGGGAPETSQNGRGRVWRERNLGSTMVDQPQDNGPGNRCSPSSDAAGQLIDVAGGWARETVGSGQVSGAMVSKRMMVTLLAPDAGYGKSTGPPSDVARWSANIAGGRHIWCLL